MINKLQLSGNELIVSGKGFGHGVGMSQWGAKALADRGKSAEEIIKYFFKGVKIIKKW